MNLLITDTTELAWLRVSGADAASFLQGQLSNDVNKLSETRAQLSSYNSAKGRMLAVLHLVKVGDEILIEVHRAILDATLARLKMFVLRAKVTLTVAGELDAIALIGDDAAAMMPRFKLPIPAQPLDGLRDERGLTVIRRLGELPRYTVLGPREALAPLRARIPEAMWEPQGTLWRRADIEAGVPVVLPATRDHFVAQMANLDLLGGISFDKGCYTGQEIVARLHYLGQLKRRLFTARISGPAPAAGSDVHVHGETQAVGEIVDAVDVGGGESLATVVLQLGSREAVLGVGQQVLKLLSGPTV